VQGAQKSTLCDRKTYDIRSAPVDNFDRCQRDTVTTAESQGLDSHLVVLKMVQYLSLSANCLNTHGGFV
jgi:hypothetical protein